MKTANTTNCQHLEQQPLETSILRNYWQRIKLYFSPKAVEREVTHPYSPNREFTIEKERKEKELLDLARRNTDIHKLLLRQIL